MAARLAELERIERAALEDFFAAAPASVGAVVEHVGGAALFTAREGAPPLFNRAVGLGVEADASEDEVDELCALGARSGLPWSLSLSPWARPRGLAERLDARGFTAGYAWMKFSRDTARVPVVETPLSIDVAGPEDADELARVVVEAFGMPATMRPWVAALPGRPGWECLAARDAGRIVAAGVSFASDGVGWLGFGATLSSHRRWGAQSALLSRRLLGLAERGIELAVVETGERVVGKPSNSYRNLLRAGFREAYLRPNLCCPGYTRLESGRLVADGAAGVGS